MPPIFSRFKAKEVPVTVHDFQSLFEQFYPSVFKQAYFILQDRSAAEDITQETFLKLYHSCPVSLKNPGAWLARVATNLTYNYLRGEKSRCTTAASPELLSVLPAGETSEEVVLKKETASSVREVLFKLPAKERMCLILRFSGFSYEEIAETIGIPGTSVGKTLARAQQKFKDLYLRQKGSDPVELL